MGNAYGCYSGVTLINAWMQWEKEDITQTSSHYYHMWYGRYSLELFLLFPYYGQEDITTTTSYIFHRLIEDVTDTSSYDCHIPMNKQQAAEYLGVSLRSITTYISQGKIGVRYERSSKGRTAVLDLEDLEELKRSLHETVHRPRKAPAAAPSPVIVQQPSAVPANINISPGPIRERSLLLTEIAVKPVLKLKEAASYSGFAQDFLLEALRDKSLKGVKIRGRWRIHREDLDSWLRILIDEAV